MLYEILIIFVCMFAALGIAELAVYLFNRSCASRLPHKFYITADNFTKEDAEFIIRYLEGVISLGGLDFFVAGIRLGEGAEIEGELLERLQREFGNIKV